MLKKHRHQFEGLKKQHGSENGIGSDMSKIPLIRFVEHFKTLTQKNNVLKALPSECDHDAKKHVQDFTHQVTGGHWENSLFS